MTDKQHINCQFGTVSIGESTARLGVKFARAVLPLDEADTMLCGKRIEGRIATIPNGEDPDQTHLFDDGSLALTASFDITRFGVDPESYTCGLTFNKHSLGDNLSRLSEFVKKSGALQIDSVGEIPDDSEGEGDGDGDDLDEAFASRNPFFDESGDKELTPEVKDNEQWKFQTLAGLGIKERTAKALRAVKINTLGQLAAWQQAKGDFWMKDIPGLGPTGAEDIERATMEYWKLHPEFADAK